jgi:hypothetical protein
VHVQTALEAEPGVSVVEKAIIKAIGQFASEIWVARRLQQYLYAVIPYEDREAYPQLFELDALQKAVVLAKGRQKQDEKGTPVASAPSEAEEAMGASYHDA